MKPSTLSRTEIQKLKAVYLFSFHAPPVCVCVCVQSCDLHVISHNAPLKVSAFKLLFTYFHPPSVCVSCASVCARVCVPEYQKPCTSPPGWGAESRSQSSNLMRDSVSLSAVVTSPLLFLFLIICMQKQGWIYGCYGGREGAHPRGMTRVTLRSARQSGSQILNCIFRHFRVIRLLSRRLWEEKTVK